MDSNGAGKLNRVQFRPGPLAEPLAERGEYDHGGAIVARDLGRYYALLARSLAALTLTEAEASLICDACNGTLWEPHTIPLLWAAVDDAIRLNGLADRWRVDGAALVVKLRALSAGETFALADAVERFWRQPGSNDHPVAVQLRAVGLLQ